MFMSVRQPLVSVTLKIHTNHQKASKYSHKAATHQYLIASTSISGLPLSLLPRSLSVQTTQVPSLSEKCKVSVKERKPSGMQHSLLVHKTP